LDRARRSAWPELEEMTQPPMNPYCAKPALDDAGLPPAGLTAGLLSAPRVHQNCGRSLAALASPRGFRGNPATVVYWLAGFITSCQEKVHIYTACARRCAGLRQARTIRIAAARLIVSSGEGNFGLRCTNRHGSAGTAHRHAPLYRYGSLLEDNWQFIANHRRILQPRACQCCVCTPAAPLAPQAQQYHRASDHRIRRVQLAKMLNQTATHPHQAYNGKAYRLQRDHGRTWEWPGVTTSAMPAALADEHARHLAVLCARRPPASVIQSRMHQQVRHAISADCGPIPQPSAHGVTIIRNVGYGGVQNESAD
jgi:hypothetical protein